MAIYEVVSGGDRQSLFKRFMHKSKMQAISELVDIHLLHCRRIEKLEAERDAALARVAELEMLLRKLSTNGLMQFSTVDEEMAVQAALGGAPVAQAQHSVPEGWMLVECGIWTQEQVDEMQKTVARFRNSELVDDRALAMAVADAGQCKAPE
ncbi:TPA: hypothetical protein NI771_006739, partial [Pseudomonas aeruginosa]|nr:hypothetical protein [Pseudomonas aeruginosa]HCF9558769.1 hypothetical protein [Pseudomonas aeruginosa]HCF9579112.1 hypothetical protein [Pseudomonas aeruginosa]HCF9592527.1 hypothetical protein [Pseudomonas aeruginosa]HCF9606115.1 hypothetical protein [Pseudomonas aeruginosa]